MAKEEYLKISIITPSFNQAKYIEETISSVLGQNYPNLEYIIIDGGSSDGSENIIKTFDKHLAYWISEKDKGQSDAINKGLKRATGDIVAWLNSDDLYLPCTLETVAKVFSDNPDVGIVYGDVENIYIDGGRKLYVNKEFELINFLSHVSIHQPSVFWRRKAHDSVGYLDESLHYLMDYDLWMHLFLNYKSMKINQILSRFRIHNDSKTYKNPPELYLEYRKVFSRFINSIPEETYKHQLAALDLYDNSEDKNYTIAKPPHKKIIKTIYKNYLLACAIQEYTFKNVKKANKLFYHAFSFTACIKIIYFLVKNNLRVQHILPKR